MRCSSPHRKALAAQEKLKEIWFQSCNEETRLRALETQVSYRTPLLFNKNKLQVQSLREQLQETNSRLDVSRSENERLRYLSSEVRVPLRVILP